MLRTIDWRVPSNELPLDAKEPPVVTGGSFLTVLQTRYEPPKAVEGERRY